MAEQYEQLDIFGETDLQFAERTALNLIKEFEPIALDDRGGQYARTITCGQYRATDTFIAEPVEGGQIIEANGVFIGQSDGFYKGELKDISRTLTARKENGVAIWTKEEK